MLQTQLRTVSAQGRSERASPPYGPRGGGVPSTRAAPRSTTDLPRHTAKGQIQTQTLETSQHPHLTTRPPPSPREPLQGALYRGGLPSVGPIPQPSGGGLNLSHPHPSTLSEHPDHLRLRRPSPPCPPSSPFTSLGWEPGTGPREAPRPTAAPSLPRGEGAASVW